jgi:hypothetical protein
MPSSRESVVRSEDKLHMMQRRLRVVKWLSTMVEHHSGNRRLHALHLTFP